MESRITSAEPGGHDRPRRGGRDFCSTAPDQDRQQQSASREINKHCLPEIVVPPGSMMTAFQRRNGARDLQLCPERQPKPEGRIPQSFGRGQGCNVSTLPSFQLEVSTPCYLAKN